MTYDADERLVTRNEASPNGLTFVPARYTYDAAGRQAQMTQTTSRPSPNPNSQTVLTTALTHAETYDGDGLGVRRATTKQVNANSPSTTTTYYLRSTVLGGRTISEYNSAGARQTSYAWAGSDILARQEGSDTATPRLRWESVNPVAGDARETDAAGNVVAATHLDPAGVDVGEGDPFGGGAGDPTAGTENTSIQSRVAHLMSVIINPRPASDNNYYVHQGFAPKSLTLESAGILYGQNCSLTIKSGSTPNSYIAPTRQQIL